MFTSAGIAPETLLHVSLRPGNDFGMPALERVAAGIAQEDMRLVTASTLAESYAATGVFDVSGSEAVLVGFGRQVQRDFISTSIGKVAAVELGSVWVEPSFRGRGIGLDLIKHTTALMAIVDFLPIAVCNQFSKKNFEAAGYEPIGTMPPAGPGRDRVVEMYTANLEKAAGYLQADNIISEVMRGIAALPRFEPIVPSGRFNRQRLNGV